MCWEDVKIARSTVTREFADDTNNGTAATAFRADPQRVGLTLMDGDSCLVTFNNNLTNPAGGATTIKASFDLTPGSGRHLSIYEVGPIITGQFFLTPLTAGPCAVAIHTMEEVGPTGSGLNANWPGVR